MIKKKVKEIIESAIVAIFYEKLLKLIRLLIRKLTEVEPEIAKKAKETAVE